MAPISKLPQDLLTMQRILPLWASVLYEIFFFLGLVLVIFTVGFVLFRSIFYLWSLPAELHFKKKHFPFFDIQTLEKDISIVLKWAQKNKNYRKSLFYLSGFLKTFFEVLLKKNISNMTAKEIQPYLQGYPEMADFFLQIEKIQYQKSPPTEEDFVFYYNQARDFLTEVQKKDFPKI